MNTGKVNIRLACKDDCTEICRLVQEFTVEFKQPAPKLSLKDFERDGFLSENPCFQCLVVEDLLSPGMLSGYALYSSIYSARVGKVLWLEDIYLSPKCRGTSVGRALFTRVCKEAMEGNCARMDFSVYTWNSAAGFYTKMGAENITNTEKWNLWRLDAKSIKELVDMQSDF